MCSLQHLIHRALVPVVQKPAPLMVQCNSVAADASVPASRTITTQTHRESRQSVQYPVWLAD